METDNERLTVQKAGVKLAISIAMADGSIDQSEGNEIKKWIKGIVDSSLPSQAENIKEDLNQALEDGFKEIKNNSINLKKICGEIKYHVLHANIWVEQLGNATEESIARLQTAINQTFPLALGMFEENKHEDTIINANLFKGESFLKKEWLKEVELIISKTKLTLPNENEVEVSLGGRKGYHTDHLNPLLEEMTEVFAIDPAAEW